MNVLSLFDGMSCGQIALNRAGIKYDNYFASEIDKFAIKVTMANYPNTIQLGSVVDVDCSKLPQIDLLIGGSPCQSFSFAGKRKGMATKCDIEILTLDHYLQLKKDGFSFEGQSYLFWEYMRILKEVKPKYFLLENVEMGEKWERILSKAIGINGIHINSALVSAQNRKRIYWTNIGTIPGGLFGDLISIIKQLKDKGILLKDILESEVDEKYFLSEKMIEFFNKNTIKMKEQGNGFAFNPSFGNNKGKGLTTKNGTRMDDNFIVHNTMPRSSTTGKGGTGPLSRNDGKTYCLDTGNTNVVEIVATQLGKSKNWGNCENGGGKSYCLQKENPHGVKLNSRIRRLTPIECERLQTVPDIENNVIFTLCYEQAKNYVSAVNKNPKLLKLVLDAEQSELNELVKSVWLNMNVNLQSKKYIVPQNVDMQIVNEIKLCTNHNLQENNTTASNAVNTAICNCQSQRVASVLQNVFISITEGEITHCGLEELPQNANHSAIQLNGNNPLNMSGNEIKQIVEDVEKNLNTKKDSNSIFITSHLLSTKNLEQALIIYYLFAKVVISGYTQKIIQAKNLSLNFSLKHGYTNHVSDSQRYKMLGNGWTIDVIAHIFYYIN